jgi:hypothetical protein
MKIVCINLWVLVLLTLAGCQNDSDYTVGNYDVTTTIKLSSCPAKIFEFPDQVALPTNLFPGEISRSHWKIQRVGITGTGAQHILIETDNIEHPDDVLTLSGTLDDGFVRVAMQKNLIEDHCETYRFILLYGVIDHEQFTGEIWTFLATLKRSDQCPTVIPLASPCEVYEEFVGTMSNEQ